VLLLLDDFRADVNGRPAILSGRTALEGAAEHGRLDVVQILLNAGAKPRDGHADFYLAVKFAERQGHWAVVRLLGQASV
jgi:ankyrin repeat protein